MCGSQLLYVLIYTQVPQSMSREPITEYEYYETMYDSELGDSDQSDTESKVSAGPLPPVLCRCGLLMLVVPYNRCSALCWGLIFATHWKIALNPVFVVHQCAAVYIYTLHLKTHYFNFPRITVTYGIYALVFIYFAFMLFYCLRRTYVDLLLATLCSSVDTCIVWFVVNISLPFSDLYHHILLCGLIGAIYSSLCSICKRSIFHAVVLIITSF